MSFTDKQVERYSRHIILEDVGVEGQQKIMDAKVLIIGAGGLGSPAALYLAAAGVGTIGIADNDRVDLTNLQRQIIHFTPDLAKPKVESAKEKIKLMNPDVDVRTHQEMVLAENIVDLIKDYDFMIDGTDNFPAKFLINDACVISNKPFSHGGILRFEGQTTTYVPGNTCYRCIFNELPPKNAIPSCVQAGVLGAIAGILGAIQATEALKYFIGKGDLLINRLLTFDALGLDFQTVNLTKNNNCKVCGDNPSIIELKDYEQPVCDTKNGNF